MIVFGFASVCLTLERCSDSRLDHAGWQFVTVMLNMNCLNCGLAHPNDAKFCANCGTRFPNASDPQQTSYQPQGPQNWPRTVPGRNSVMRNIGLGCLVVLLIFLFFGLSCTRACFRHRRYYRRYGAVVYPVARRGPSAPLYARTAKLFPIAGQQFSISGYRYRYVAELLARPGRG